MAMDALQALTNRVSGHRLVEPAPDNAALRLLLAAALRAPDHGRLKPWRFTVIRGGARHKFGNLLADSFLKLHPGATPAQLDRERAKPLRAPLIVVVGARVTVNLSIPAIEQIHAAVAGAQNIMVGAYAMGFGCTWKTGAAAYSQDVKAAFDLAPTDAIVGFLYLGTCATPPAVASALPAEDYMREFA